MHHHKTGKRHGEVVAQSLLTQLGGQMETVALTEFVVCDFRQEVATVQNLEEQFVTFFAIFPHQRTERFHSRCLYLLETIELISLFDGIKDISALSHLQRREVARSFRYTWFHFDYRDLTVDYRL